MRSFCTDAGLRERNPTRGIFLVGCCASARTLRAKSKTLSARAMILFFISFSLSPATRHSTLATPPFSLDHPVRPVQQRLRNRHADLFRRFQIDHQLKLRRLLDRKIGRLSTFEDFVYVPRFAPLPVREFLAVGHEPAGLYRCSADVCRQ